MTHVKELHEVYKCKICGNVAEIIFAGDGELVCCGKPMELQKENTTDAAQEKHVPVVEDQEKGILVKVGEVPHPMEEDHYIEWIEIISEDKTVRKTFKPGDKPEKKFCLKGKVRAYCNLHGLWKA